MNVYYFRKLLFAAVLLLCGTVASAHDIEVGGFYYNIISSSDLTVEVTHKGSSWGLYYEYSGKLVIPETVTYKSKTYRVTTIGSGAFDGCTGLTSVTIPNSVTTIGYFAFRDCTNLKEIYSLSETPPVIYSYTFSNYSATLYVPIGAKETYQTTDYWKEFANIVEMDFTGITEISPDATDGFGNGAIYDLYGRPVSKPAKGGIYIIGGKKVVL